MKGCAMARSGRCFAGALVLALLAAAPLLAQEALPPDCSCRYQGRDVALGQCRCLTIGSKSAQACCTMVLNNTSWQFTGEACPLARGDQPDSARSRPSSASSQASSAASS